MGDGRPAATGQVGGVDRLVGGRSVELTQPVPVGVDQLDSGADGHAVRVSAEVGHLPLEPVGQGDVVGVHPGGELAPGQPKHLIEGDDEPGVRPTDQADAGVPGGVLPEDRRRPVGRAVVDDQELEVGERLTEDALDRLGHVPLGVVHRHQHVDGRRRAHSSGPRHTA